MTKQSAEFLAWMQSRRPCSEPTHELMLQTLAAVRIYVTQYSEEAAHGIQEAERQLETILRAGK